MFKDVRSEATTKELVEIVQLTRDIWDILEFETKLAEESLKITEFKIVEVEIFTISEEIKLVKWIN